MSRARTIIFSLLLILSGGLFLISVLLQPWDGVWSKLTLTLNIAMILVALVMLGKLLLWPASDRRSEPHSLKSAPFYIAIFVARVLALVAAPMMFFHAFMLRADLAVSLMKIAAGFQFLAIFVIAGPTPKSVAKSKALKP